MVREQIPILDLRPEIESLWDEINGAFQKVLRSTHFINGPDVAEFEKDVAKYLGFAWRTADASGMDSVGWYEAWLSTGSVDDLDRIINYNEDDVRATWHVIQWLSQHHE